MYADDTSLYYQASDIETLDEAINNDLIQLETWLNGNKLSLNVAKTNSMLISTKQKHKILKNRDEDLKLKIRNKELEVIKQTKYLGMAIDNSLNWKEHIKTVSTKVSKAVGFLRRSKTFLPQETLKTLYKGIVEPHFRYCCSVWGCASSNELNQLQKLQNRSARILTNSSVDTPGRLLIDRLGWKTIDQLIAEESKTMVYKSMHEMAPPYLCDLFTKNSTSSSYVLRHTATDLKLPKKCHLMGRYVFLIEELKCGMIFLPKLSRHLLWLFSKSLFKFFTFFFFPFLY